MLSPSRSLLPLLGGALLLATACQSGSNAPTNAAPAATPTPAPAIPASVWDADLAPGQGLLGLNQVTLDLAQFSAVVEPVRMAAAIGDSFDVDIYEYLKKSPCSDCLKVEGLQYNGGNVEVRFAARHPFAFGPARYDLHVFDVRGTLIPISGNASPSGIQSQMGAASQEATGAFGILANADGYSSFFTEQVAPYVGGVGAVGTIFPYRTMFRDLGPSSYLPGTWSFADLQFPGGHNVMAMGEGFDASSTPFEIDVQGLGNQVQFLFLLDAAYGASATRPTRLTPRYFLPEFHRKEAFEASMEITGGTLPAGGGPAFVQAVVTARDWQGDAIANPAFGPDAPADSLKHQSSVASIEFFVPGVTTGAPQVKTNGVDFTGVVNAGEYWTTYEAIFSFQNQAAASEGMYWAVAAIRDSLYNTGDALAVTRQFPAGQPPQPLTDLTTYVVAAVEVEANGPTFDLERNPVPADPVHHGDLVQFLISNINPGPFSVTAVEADPAWNGVAANFTPSVPCTFINATTYQTEYDWRNVAHLPTPATPRQFAVRVTDSNGGTRIQSVPVQLTPNVAPTIAWTGSAPTNGNAGSPYTVQASHVNASDTDGTVTSYRINWGDATPDYIGTLPTSHTYSSPAAYTITIYARDNGYGPATTPAPLPTQAESAGATLNVTINPGGLTAPWVEDFETTADGALPANWVNFAPASVGTTYQFGVRSGTTSPIPTAGQAKVLEESGFGQTTPGDRNYATTNPGTIAGAPQAARWGTFTPEILIPTGPGTWVLEITHWHAYNYVTLSPPCGSSFGGDGSNVMTKAGAPGTVTATETGLVRHVPAEFTLYPPFYNANAGADGNFFLGLPGSWTSTSPMWGRGTSNTCPNAAGGYQVSRLTLPDSYKGQAIRVYFWHGQQQNFSGWNGVGGSFWSNTATGYNGWRIDKVEIKTL